MTLIILFAYKEIIMCDMFYIVNAALNNLGVFRAESLPSDNGPKRIEDSNVEVMAYVNRLPIKFFQNQT
jgi:hypothetical protein